MMETFGTLLGLELRHWWRGTASVSIHCPLAWNGRDLVIPEAPGLERFLGWRVLSVFYAKPDATTEKYGRPDGRPSEHWFRRKPRLERMGAEIRLPDVRMELNQLGQPMEIVS